MKLTLDLRSMEKKWRPGVGKPGSKIKFCFRYQAKLEAILTEEGLVKLLSKVKDGMIEVEIK